nr:MAG TPA: hypothetical protein [Caudoviricetes sp.]
MMIHYKVCWKFLPPLTESLLLKRWLIVQYPELLYLV